MVRSGALGRICIVDGEFASGDPGLLREPDDLSKRHWHFNPGVMGMGAILGEMGSHVHNAIEFVTGARVDSVSASFDTVAERREVYDNAYLNISMTDGAVGRLWSSYVAVGSEHGMRFRIIGDEGSLTWHQETPEYLYFGQAGQALRRLSRGMDDLESLSLASTRIRPGHPEGYILAFATIYREFNRAILLKLIGEDPAPALALLPDIDDGVSTMRLVDAAVKSHLAGSVRKPL
jgi:predicted dehydrogenase